jgi:hypothetical protein
MRAASHRRGQGAEESTTRRGQAGPGLARGQQKAHDDRHGKTEQHLVRVPQQRCHGEVHLDLTKKQGQPERYCQCTERGGAPR